MSVGRYYDEMHEFTLRHAPFRDHSGFAHDTIHRALQDRADGTFSPDTIYRLLAPHLPSGEAFRGLDAGCGYGGTCFRLLPVTGGTWHGVTVSAKQVEVARELAAARGLSGRVGFSLRSYDLPMDGRYDAIVAIESLAHSEDTSASVRNLAAHLRPGGVLAVVDDVPRDGLGATEAAWLREFKRFWHLPVLPGRTAWGAIFAGAGLVAECDEDLTPLTRPRDAAMLEEAWAHHAAVLPAREAEGLGSVAAGELGGIRLEQLTRAGAVSYRLMVARAP